MEHLDAPLDRIASPAFANELHAIVQFFTATLGGFAVTAFVIAEPHIGLTLCVLGIVLVFPAWLVVSLGVRMAIETGLAILSIHHHINHYAQPTKPPSDEKAIER
ncbi:hypothetical protein E1264_34500 [Actinomadura sp. KC216]|uniref:hypothetical protein n=1 Tax=Actinomadura sp. KC216 TaxID=2530370 RepID=UPI00104DF401|nr:hypothetical protein [Actinomadura sp. KC216]TDB80185.1 hypothetical protein E1264_34500 [Actinomadura sp. KC216]